MKKVIVLAGMLAITLASCKKNEPAAPEPMPTPAPVENPAPPPAPAPQTQTQTTTTTTTTTEEKDGTSLSVGSDGVDFKTKNGDNENNVTIKRQEKKVEIKTD
jgi:hypothetical protein